MKKEEQRKKSSTWGNRQSSQTLDALDAERAILRLKFGNAILQAAIDLLADTIRQPTKSQKLTESPVLGRIILHPAPHPTQSGRPRKESPPTHGDNPPHQRLAGEPAE
jgi:hypothetical protein